MKLISTKYITAVGNDDKNRSEHSSFSSFRKAREKVATEGTYETRKIILNSYNYNKSITKASLKMTEKNYKYIPYE